MLLNILSSGLCKVIAAVSNNCLEMKVLYRQPLSIAIKISCFKYLCVKLNKIAVPSNGLDLTA